MMSQDIKLLDHALQFKKHKVATRDCYEIKYKENLAVDSIHRSYEEYNQNGRLMKFTEYYSKGKEMAVYRYEYDEKGNITRNTLSLVFNNWQEIEMILTFNEKGRLIQREMPETIANFWCKETFTYGSDGKMVRSDQWYMTGGATKALSHKNYSDQIESRENSPTHIYDTKGLLIIHQTYKNGISDSAFCYNYTYQ